MFYVVPAMLIGRARKAPAYGLLLLQPIVMRQRKGIIVVTIKANVGRGNTDYTMTV